MLILLKCLLWINVKSCATGRYKMLQEKYNYCRTMRLLCRSDSDRQCTTASVRRRSRYDGRTYRTHSSSESDAVSWGPRQACQSRISNWICHHTGSAVMLQSFITVVSACLVVFLPISRFNHQLSCTTHNAEGEVWAHNHDTLRWLPVSVTWGNTETQKLHVFTNVVVLLFQSSTHRCLISSVLLICNSYSHCHRLLKSCIQ